MGNPWRAVFQGAVKVVVMMVMVGGNEKRVVRVVRVKRVVRKRESMKVVMVGVQRSEYPRSRRVVMRRVLEKR